MERAATTMIITAIYNTKNRNFKKEQVVQLVLYNNVQNCIVNGFYRNSNWVVKLSVILMLLV